MFNRFIVTFTVFVCLVLILSGATCLPEEEAVEEVDEKALQVINSYVGEMTARLLDETLKADLKGWTRHPHEDDIPYTYDEERMQWLKGHSREIKDLRREHYQGDFPSLEEVASWEVIVVRGGREWTLDGEEWAGALLRLDDLIEELVIVIHMIVANDGELDRVQSKRVGALVDSIEPEVRAVREVFFGE